MKGDPKVLDHLNELLAGELTAIDQYFVHAQMYDDWGFTKLRDQVAHEMTEEQTHAQQLISRILFLEGTPDLTQRSPLQVGRDVPEMLRNDLALEIQVVSDLRDVIAHCENVRDYQTREILETMLADTEEDHARWLEQQLRLIGLIGLQNYLQSQV